MTVRVARTALHENGGSATASQPRPEFHKVMIYCDESVHLPAATIEGAVFPFARPI
jgi:hypothetical protein